jgi:hypothetical protein
MNKTTLSLVEKFKKLENLRYFSNSKEISKYDISEYEIKYYALRDDCKGISCIKNIREFIELDAVLQVQIDLNNFQVTVEVFVYDSGGDEEEVFRGDYPLESIIGNKLIKEILKKNFKE